MRKSNMHIRFAPFTGKVLLRESSKILVAFTTRSILTRLSDLCRFLHPYFFTFKTTGIVVPHLKCLVKNRGDHLAQQQLKMLERLDSV